MQGVNFSAFWNEQESIDLNALETNDIAAFLRVYGVEAARANIVKEMNAVFGGLLSSPAPLPPSNPSILIALCE